MMIRDGKITTIIQQQEEEKVLKQMEKEQQNMSSTRTKRDLLLVQRVLSLHHFLQSSVPQNLGVPSKVTTLAMDSMFFFADHLLHLQAVFRVARKNEHYTNSSTLGIICTNGLMNPTERINNRASKTFSGFPSYDIWSLGCIIYHLLFGYPLFKFDSQQINSLMSIFIHHCFHLLAMFMLSL